MAKGSAKNRKRRRQKLTLRKTKRTDPDDVEVDDTPFTGSGGPHGGAGASSRNLLGKLPNELVCEILSCLDLGDLVHLARTSPALNAMLLAPSAQSIWSSSRRKAGYVLFPGMSEIKFAVTMEGSLCQASSSCRPCTANHYCGVKGDLEMKWMARMCKRCKQLRAGPPKQLYSYLRPRHELLLSCIETVSSAWVASWGREYILDELGAVDTALYTAQAADDADKAARLATGLPGTAEQPSHVQRYVADRKRLLAERDQARQVNEPARSALRGTQKLELLARRKIGSFVRAGKTLEILRALQDGHDWARQDLAELEGHLSREPEDQAFDGGMPDVPLALPDHAPFGSVFPSFLPVPLVIITHPTLEPVWRHFKAKFIAHSKDSSHRDSQRKKTVRLRAECVRSSYEACRPALALALCMPVDALPTWDHMKEAPEVEVLCWMPLMFLQEKPSAEFQQIFERAVEADRLIAVRHALAAQLDISVEELSCDPDDYPATAYDKSFLDRVINRFEVGQSDYLTYHEALATGHSAEALSQMTRPAWRRAIAHVLRAAEIEDTECSLDKLDALGAGFRWKNAPPGYKGRAYSWRRMVELLLRGGPKGLHLADLQNFQLVYERPEAADELDKNPSRPAKNLAATEEKTATSSRSGRLVTNDMITDDTTANDSSLNASTSNSSRGTAAATAKATAAPTLGLRRSSRLAPTL
ncbi:hypothetical protein RHOSPDRAFT_27751 [Rhodotorula sp. JG-1b]|nr:hypothetical protein RHOSPDRAFT_27751 [Rhodotorula sp. JG-1b]